jgi:hypothetical protein
VRCCRSTARVMAEQPVLMRLKELETLKQMAERIDEVRLVVGTDGLDKLLPRSCSAARRRDRNNANQRSTTAAAWR